MRSVLIVLVLFLSTQAAYAWEQKIYRAPDAGLMSKLCYEAHKKSRNQAAQDYLKSGTAAGYRELQKESAANMKCANDYSFDNKVLAFGVILCDSETKSKSGVRNFENEKDCLRSLVSEVSDENESAQEGEHTHAIADIVSRCNARYANTQAYVECVRPKLTAYSLTIKPQEEWKKPAPVAKANTPREKGTRMPGPRQIPTVIIPAAKRPAAK